MRKWMFMLVLVLALAGLAGCQAAGGRAPAATGTQASSPATLVVAAHDSFAVSEDVVQAFEQANNAKVQFLALGDAGAALNKIILSKDAPLADVFFGVDNTFLSRALAADVFESYTPAGSDAIPAGLHLDPDSGLTPIDFGYVNLNADSAWFEEHGIPLPTRLEDLAEPAYKGLLVMPNPATSSPGLAFLLATVGHFGEDRYLDFWEALAANDVLITSGWSEAYYDHFTVGSGGEGDRPLVVSYASSPPADVVFAADGRTEPASVSLDLPGGAFRQVEYAGVLRGAKQPELARRWMDYMVGRAFQEDIPLQMFVYPANAEAKLPELFTRFAPLPSEPAVVEPAAIDANRERWVQAWTETVLR